MSGRLGGPEPSQRFSDEQIVNWLIDECRDAGNRVSALTTSGDRILAAGSTVIALLATIAVGGGKGYLLMWLPLGVSIVIVYGLYLNNMTRALIGYKIGLEKEIEKRVGVPLITWQSRVNVRAGSSHHVKSLLLMGAVVYAASAGLGLSQAFHTLVSGAWGQERAWLYIALTSVSIILGTAVICYCLWIQRGTRKATEQQVTSMFTATGRPNNL
ncbi:hypothetical protein GCM10009837_35790 [Streptomyces durmitorensis]|uniref:Uncharacterized protein n=1 Tax=Streptomyces durmitorensis TaxID=319947 RepID=A0ABY4PUQ2_9ACTN|nr:hypothetical protein [Streptomyces durmitorensis]UQT57593.1 hypothetical protein M4V62_22195 [Streptomyces durmitorensis]